MSAPLCFVSAPYANQLPLAHFIPEVAPHARLLLVARPSDVPAQLASGAADAALLPVAELFRRPELDVIDGSGVCVTRRVRSVLLKCQVRPADVRTVASDPASLTSNMLARILFERLWKQPVRFVAPGELAAPDASVMIGDPALCSPPAPGGDIDLADAWNDLTGLPFVFAVWAHRRGHPQAQELARIVGAAKAKGVASLPELAALTAARLGLSAADCLDYLTRCIHFDVGDAEREALRLFQRLASEPAEPSKEPQP